jgi:hypothetical protein
MQTYDVECWGLRRPLTEHQNFFVIEAYKLFGKNLRLFIKTSEFTIRPLTVTLSRSTDGLDMQMKKKISNLVLDKYFDHLLLLLKITLKSLVEKKSLLLLALSAINHI